MAEAVNAESGQYDRLGLHAAPVQGTSAEFELEIRQSGSLQNRVAGRLRLSQSACELTALAGMTLRDALLDQELDNFREQFNTLYTKLGTQHVADLRNASVMAT